MTNRAYNRPRADRSYLLAVLSGALYFLGFAGFDLWPLAFIALIPLFVVLNGEPLSGGRATLVGIVFGFTTHAGGYYWLVGMLKNFSGFPLFVCLLFTAVVCLYQGGQLALFFWLLSRARARGRSATWSAIPIYCAVEIAYPLLFPSYYCNSLYDLPLLLQVVDLGGPILLTAVTIAINGAIYELARAWLSGKAIERALPVTAAVALCLTLGYGWYRCREVDARVATAEKTTVGIVQANMGIFSKSRDVVEGHRRHLEQSLHLERSVSPDLIVWPESAFQRAIRPGQNNVRETVLGSLTTPLLFGGLAIRRVDGKRRVYNTAFMTNSQGDILSTYDKTYLLAFGEFIPFGETFPILYKWSPQTSHFTPGDHVRSLPFNRYRITTLICYEDIVPGFVRRAVKQGNPHLLVNITNDSWFGDTNEPWIHLALAKFRAVEHHRYLVRATNSGVSAVIDPLGRTLIKSPVFERATLHARVAMLNTPTLYQQLGDWPGWLALFWTIGAFFLPLRRSTPEGIGSGERPAQKKSKARA
ncbi:MAG: apolipoprotein N-acyltransferase [Deltaproteobacteria bacterium]|nr:apolipoprotein N-acyltransferase [Deltaproteobacteria bacterium]